MHTALVTTRNTGISAWLIVGRKIQICAVRRQKQNHCFKAVKQSKNQEFLTYKPFTDELKEYAE